MKMKKAILFLLVAVLFLNGSYIPTSAKKNEKPYITAKEKICEVGDRFYVKLKGTKAVEYIIADDTVAKVSAKGKVKIKRAGKTKLTILGENGKNYTCKIKAYDHAKNSISLTAEGKDSKTTAKIKAEDVPTVDFKVSPATLINFTHIHNTKGVPEGLISLKKSKVSKKLKYRDADCRLQAGVIKPLTSMVEDAYAAGKYTFTIEAGGGYREYSTQDRYWQRRQNMYPGYGDDPYHNGGVICVPAVSSEHRTGYAIDFEATEAGFKWLKENSYKYGFIHRYTGDKTEKTGVMDEDCHYTYVGKAVAATCYLEGLCLEEYYEKYVWSDENT